MRVGFFGKGGSGKTTMTAAYARNLIKNEGRSEVLAIDADHNKHLGEALGIKKSSKQLGNFREEIKEYVRGERGEIEMVATTPPSEKSRFIQPDPEDGFIQEYAVTEDSISLMTVGSYEHGDCGATCYHGKLDSLTYVMNHLLDTERDQVVVDATAGVDTYGSSLVAAYDLNVLVVEPTNKAIEVYKEFEELMSNFHSEIAVVVNKIETEGDKQFIKDRIPEEKIIGFVERSEELRKHEQGDEEAFERFIDQNREVFERILERSEKVGKNWDEYLDSLKKIHISGSEAWWDEYHDEDISGQAETGFKYQEVSGRDD